MVALALEDVARTPAAVRSVPEPLEEKKAEAVIGGQSVRALMHRSGLTSLSGCSWRCTLRARTARSARGEIVPCLSSEPGCQKERSRSCHLSQPGQLRRKSTVVASKRDWMKKFMSKLSFGSLSSGPSRSPSIKQAKLPEIFEHLATLQTGDEASLHCDVAENPTEAPVSQHYVKGELLMTLMMTRNTQYVRSSSELAKPSEKNECEVNAPRGVVQNETTLTGKGEAIVVEMPEWKGLAEADAAASKMRNVPQENGPCEEDDLSEHLRGPRKAQPIVKGTLPSFLEGRNEDLYTLLYYHELEDERDESGYSSSVQEGAATGPCTAGFAKDRGRQYAATRDGRPRRTCSRPSSSTSYEPITAVESECQTKCLMRTAGAWNPHLLVVTCDSCRRFTKRATTWRRLTRDAALQRALESWCQRYRSEMHKSRSSKRGRELSEAACSREVH